MHTILFMLLLHGNLIFHSAEKMKVNLRRYFDQELLDRRVTFGTMTDEQALFLLCTQCFEVRHLVFNYVMFLHSYMYICNE